MGRASVYGTEGVCFSNEKRRLREGSINQSGSMPEKRIEVSVNLFYRACVFSLAAMMVIAAET